MRIVLADEDHAGPWAQLRAALWPDQTAGAHRAELAPFLSGGSDAAAFLAVTDTGEVAGFAEAALRRDYVNGCETSPVLFLEGIYVRPEDRKAGVGRALCDAVAAWGRAAGCSEFASDALMNNADSHAFHAALGFAETERVVYFRKTLAADGARELLPQVQPTRSRT